WGGRTRRGLGAAVVHGWPWWIGIVSTGAVLFLAIPMACVTMLFGGEFDDPADGFRQSTADEATAAYRAHPEVCERLRRMLAEDRLLENVGRQHIGAWFRAFGGWESTARPEPRRPRTTELRDVLADVGLSAARHQEYARLLESLGAYEARHCDGRSGYDCEVGFSRCGNVVSSVTWSFVHSPSGAAPPALRPRQDDPDEERFTPL